MAGQVEVKVVADSDILLIRRARFADTEQGQSTPEASGTSASWRGLCYQYDPTSEELTDVDADRWVQAEGEAAVCEALPNTLSTVYGRYVYRKGYILQIGNEELGRSDGLSGRAIAHAPSGDLAAVLLAKSNVRLPGLVMPSGGSYGSSRRHYHQLVDVRNPAWKGRLIRVPMVTRLAGKPARPGRDRLLDQCWTPDERFVIYVGRKSLAIVPVDR